MDLLEFPKEILEYIILEIDIKSFSRLIVVCKFMRKSCMVYYRYIKLSKSIIGVIDNKAINNYRVSIFKKFQLQSEAVNTETDFSIIPLKFYFSNELIYLNQIIRSTCFDCLYKLKQDLGKIDNDLYKSHLRILIESASHGHAFFGTQHSDYCWNISEIRKCLKNLQIDFDKIPYIQNESININKENISIKFKFNDFEYDH